MLKDSALLFEHQQWSPSSNVDDGEGNGGRSSATTGCQAILGNARTDRPESGRSVRGMLAPLSSSFVVLPPLTGGMFRRSRGSILGV
jgi:hypothetical protein